MLQGAFSLLHVNFVLTDGGSALEGAGGKRWSFDTVNLSGGFSLDRC